MLPNACRIADYDPRVADTQVEPRGVVQDAAGIGVGAESPLAVGIIAVTGYEGAEVGHGCG